jgi:hypothetical protein
MSLKSRPLQGVLVLMIVVPLLIPFAAGAASGERSLVCKAEGHSFETDEVAEIRFESDVDCSLEIQFWDKQIADLSWTIEASGEPAALGADGGELACALKVTAEKKASTVRIQAVSTGRRFTLVKRRASNGGQETYMLDEATAILWKVGIHAKLPRTIDIDTTRFRGTSYFPEAHGSTRR